jgi:exopolysaccharide biosynthesis protein
MAGRHERQGGRGGRRSWPTTLYVAAVLCFTVYLLLDTFVIQRTYSAIAVGSAAKTAETSSSSTATTNAEKASTTDASDSGTSVSLSTSRYEDTTVYVVDIYTDDVTSLMAALANDTYGKNVTETTSQMAEDNNATVAINGDYYGARNSGYVIRDGILYRDTAASSDQEDLVIYSDGTFDIVTEGSVTAEDLLANGAWQVFSFGPGLIDDGSITVTANSEVDQAMASNPRTAIGKVADGHYVLVVSDGRTSESAGLTLYQLATYMSDELGCETAYNLDGGGSSTLYYDGSVVNNPTTNGDKITERSVSDIVYLTA